MSAQELDVKRSWRAIRRHRFAVLAGVAAGLLIGFGLALLNPPMHRATALVVLPPPPVSAPEVSAGSHSIETQVLIASSEPVLSSAGQNVNPPMSTSALRERVDVVALTREVIEIEATGATANEAIDLANTVAEVYLVYVSTERDLPTDLAQRTGARMLEVATTARGGSLAKHLGLFGLPGAVVGGLVASVVILAVARGDRRLRLRQEIADAVGIPVLASVSTYRAADVSDWANLLERYTPTAVDAWSMRKMLHHLRVDAKLGDPVSLAVITFAGDDKALPLAPQLAAFAVSSGIQAELDVDPHNAGTNGAPEADEAASIPADHVSHPAGNGKPSSTPTADGLLQIRLIVVDRNTPQLTGVRPTTATVVGVSSGAVTAEELARLAVAAAGVDRMIDGLMVAEPDPTDHTTGRIPQASQRSTAGLPTRLIAARRSAQ